MSHNLEKLQALIDRAHELAPVRVAVACAAQLVLLETLRDATLVGLVVPRLVGDRDTILSLGRDLDWKIDPDWVIAAATDTEIASLAGPPWRSRCFDEGQPAHRCLDAGCA